MPMETARGIIQIESGKNYYWRATRPEPAHSAGSHLRIGGKEEAAAGERERERERKRREREKSKRSRRRKSRVVEKRGRKEGDDEDGGGDGRRNGQQSEEVR